MRNDVVEIRTLISHPMETGYRRNKYGEKLPRHIIVRFAVEYLGQQVFSAEFGPGVAANPYLSFFLRFVESGTVVLVWEDDKQQRWESVHEVEVS